MNNFQTKSFKKWAGKEGIPVEKLLDAVDRIDKNLGIVDLGSDLYKVRIAKNKGKSGGYRTIMIYKKDFRSLFIYGFGKNQKDNITEKELNEAKKYAQDFLSYSEDYVKSLLENKSIFSLEAQ
jgi:hypothetical protein